MKKKTNIAALFSGKKKTGLFSFGGKKRKKRYKANRNRLAGLRLILAPSKKKTESGTQAAKTESGKTEAVKGGFFDWIINLIKAMFAKIFGVFGRDR